MKRAAAFGAVMIVLVAGACLLTVGPGLDGEQTLLIGAELPSSTWLKGRWYDGDGWLDVVAIRDERGTSLWLRPNSWLASFCGGAPPSGALTVGDHLQLQCSNGWEAPTMVLRENRWLNFHNYWLRRDPNPFWLLRARMPRLRKSVDDFVVEHL